MQQGEVLAGKYQIGRQIGAGGMSTVVEALDLTLDRPVAIKFVRGSGDSTSRERLRREAIAVAQFQSEHIVRVFETGVDDFGGLFIVMERLRGVDVQTQIRQSGPITPDESVSYVLQVCEALAHAHVAQIVHRDIKPSNMFVVSGHNGRKTIKLLDFGIALNRGIRKNSSLTRDNLLGTPHFMSPEQIREPKTVDARTDIWALGVSLYQMLSGQLPFQSPNLGELIMNICEADAPSLVSLGIAVPAGLEACVRRCMRKAPDERFPSVRELAEALLPFAPMATGRLLFDGISNILVGLGSTVDAPVIPSPETAAPTRPRPTSGIPSVMPDTIDDDDEIDTESASAIPTLSLHEDPDEPSTEPTERGNKQSHRIAPDLATITQPNSAVSTVREEFAPPGGRISSPPLSDSLSTGGPVVSPSRQSIPPKSRSRDLVMLSGAAVLFLLVGASAGAFLLRGEKPSVREGSASTTPAPLPSPEVLSTAAPSAMAPPSAPVQASATPSVTAPAVASSVASSASPKSTAKVLPLPPPVKTTSDPSLVPLPPELKGRH